MTTDLDPHDLWDDLVRAGDVPPPTADVLARTREVARRSADDLLRVSRARKARRRRIRYGVVAAAAVGVLTLGAVTVDVGGHHVTGDSAAATTLRRAASATLAQHDPVVRPGQYLRVTLLEDSWSQYTEDSGPVVGRDDKPVITEERRHRTIWIPHDVDRHWTFRNRFRVVRRISRDPRYRWPAEPPSLTRGLSWAASGDSHIDLYDPRWYATLPRDPQQLIARLDERFHGEGHGLAYRFSEEYSEVLRSGLAPADVRAALFRGLAELPGMEVEGDVTFAGHAAVAIGADGSTFQMMFDEETGLYIGARATDPSFPEVPGIDAARTTYLAIVTTTVVDTAPRAPFVHVPQG